MNNEQSIKYFLIAGCLVFSFPCFAGQSQNVIINEIAWMGTENSASDEWIELYNNTESAFDLNNWKLIAQDGSPEIDLKGTIFAKGFFILERTDNNTLPKIKADQVYTGALNNKGEHLKLINEQKDIIDEINCLNGWLAGDNKTKQTMERVMDIWQTSKEPGGTPKQQNSTGARPKQTNGQTPASNQITPSEATLSLPNNDKLSSSPNNQNLEIGEKELLGAMSETLNQEFTEQKISKDFLFIFLIASFLAVIFGTFILFFKKKLHNIA